jgi:predicted RNA-binding protein with PUA-like domain
MAHWLMKSEPGSYGWDDLVRDGGTEWDGVRNAAARLHLRAMQEGEEAFLYHSGAGKAVVGVVRIARDPVPIRRTRTGSRSGSSRSAPSPVQSR